MNAPGPSGKFTAELWSSVSDIRQGIVSSEFIRGLADGTLEDKIFAGYIAQDILYLRQDNEALLRLSERTPDDRYGTFFRRLAHDGIASEKIMLEEFVPLFNVKNTLEQTPAFAAYGKFLLLHANDSSFEVAAAALLPCFWLFAWTGISVYSLSRHDNKYIGFIETYSSPSFSLLVKEYIDITEEISLKADAGLKALMKKAFIEAAGFELLIFSETIS